ncbi:6721_t:CDS:10, partial [Acaulospora colombiana]
RYTYHYINDHRIFVKKFSEFEMAIQQDSRPALPPRPTEFSGCAKTPPAWLMALTRHPEKNHTHKFYSSPVLEDGSENVVGIICISCHKRFKLTTSNENLDAMNDGQGTCATNYENSLHHLHTRDATESRVYSSCCLCNFAVEVEIIEPIVGIPIFSNLSSNRMKGNLSYSRTINCLTRLVKDFLEEGQQRPLNVDGTAFSEQIGRDESSWAFFQKLGYTMEEGPEKVEYRPPPFNDETRARFERVSEELDLQSLEFDFNMDDGILVWAYKLATSENPEKTPNYLQVVLDLFSDKNSETLGELLAMENSKGNFTMSDVNDAYKEMSSDRIVDDEMLISAYNSHVSENPLKRKNQRDALTIIGKYRGSQKIQEFLREEEARHGLDNIGNTCYLNSLLQYYFTIRNLREAVLHSDSVSADLLDLWGETVTIGGRKVSKIEVERARKFVTLLRNLFEDLIQSSHTSITPNSDLAYLALVNAKNDEEHPKESSSRSPMDTTVNSVDMQIDDSSPGPSSTRATDPLSTTDLIDLNNGMDESETVIISGTALPTASTELFFQTADTFMNDDNNFYKGKERENNHLDEQMYGDNKEDKLKKVSGMLFGKQQDVTECMDNVMFQLEAALKSTVDVNEQNIVRSLFYGNSKQILRYKDPNTGSTVENVDFNGTQAEREITLVTSPPILQIQVQRVQFDRSTSNIYKSNAYLRFEETIYLDRYLDANREQLRSRIAEAHSFKQEIYSLQEELKALSCDKKTSLPITDLLTSTVKFVQSMKYDDPEFIMDENSERQLSEIRRESEQIYSKIGG